MVQVVELLDAGPAGHYQLGVDRSRQRQIAVRVEPAGQVVHLLAPGRKRAVLGAATQRPVERVRVRVRRTRKHQPGEPMGTRQRRHPGTHGDDATVGTGLHLDPADDASEQPGMLAPVGLT
jgi:hypothetical protein